MSSLVRHDDDIPCYKVFIVENGEFKSPYFDYTKWVVGHTRRIHDLESQITVLGEPCPEIVKETSSQGDVSYNIYGRAFHSYKTLEGANYVYNYLLRNIPNISSICPSKKPESVAILECVIPKESKYTYEGTSDFVYSTYASQQLKPLSVLVQTDIKY